MPVKPSDSEEEYFKKQEIEKLRKARTEAARQIAEQERHQLKELHWMRCPKCGMELAEVTYRGVRVDSCFNCSGMYLDKGEMEKAMAYKDPGWLGRAMMSMLGSEIEDDSTES